MLNYICKCKDVMMFYLRWSFFSLSSISSCPLLIKKCVKPQDAGNLNEIMDGCAV